MPSRSHRGQAPARLIHLSVPSVLFVLSVLFAAALLPPPASCAPNFVVLLADDLGYADVGFNGGREIQTPRIDALAASGARLAQFYAQPLCSPTRAALLTGRYPMRHGLQVGVVRPWARYGLPLEEHTLAQALHEAGYRTTIVGKWHLGAHDSAYLPTRRGFDHHYGHYLGAIDYFTHERDGGFDWHRDSQVNRDSGYSTHLIAREAVRTIREAPVGQPLLLLVAFNAVHAPHQVPETYKRPYAALPEPRRTYAGMLAAMDEAIGQIMAALDERGMRTNTLVVFSSDNGGFAPGRVTDNGSLRAGKGTLYEGGVRVAACVSWPGRIRGGTVIEEPLHVVDLFPTVLKMAGATIRPPLALDGVDFGSVLFGSKPAAARGEEREILINTEPGRGAIRRGDWKLILNGERISGDEDAEVAVAGGGAGDAGEKIELFDLAKDPGEKVNLAAAEPAKVRTLRQAYDRWASQAIPPKARPRPPGFKSPKVWGE